jgi:outer membrane protein assembly factor BamB
VRAVHIDSSGHPHVLWHAASNITGSPVVGGGRVWSIDPGSGRLYALNPATGATINSVDVGSVGHFPTPAIYGRRLFVPTLAGVTVVSSS